MRRGNPQGKLRTSSDWQLDSPWPETERFEIRQKPANAIALWRETCASFRPLKKWGLRKTGAVHSSTLRRRAPNPQVHPRDVICQTQTLAAPGADATETGVWPSSPAPRVISGTCLTFTPSSCEPSFGPVTVDEA